MSLCKNKESQLVVISNEYVTDVSFIYLHEHNIEYYDKQDLVSNNEFEAITPSIKNDFFHQRMINFLTN